MQKDFLNGKVKKKLDEEKFEFPDSRRATPGYPAGSLPPPPLRPLTGTPPPPPSSQPPDPAFPSPQSPAPRLAASPRSPRAPGLRARSPPAQPPEPKPPVVPCRPLTYVPTAPSPRDSPRRGSTRALHAANRAPTTPFAGLVAAPLNPRIRTRRPPRPGLLYPRSPGLRRLRPAHQRDAGPIWQRKVWRTSSLCGKIPKSTFLLVERQETSHSLTKPCRFPLRNFASAVFGSWEVEAVRREALAEGGGQGRGEASVRVLTGPCRARGPRRGGKGSPPKGAFPKFEKSGGPDRLENEVGIGGRNRRWSMRSGGRKGGVPQGRRLPYPIVSRTRRPVLSRRASYPAKVDRLSYTGKGRASLPCQRRLAILARDQYTATLPELTGHSIWAAIARCYAAFAAPLRGSPRAEKSRLPCQEELGYPVEVIGR